MFLQEQQNKRNVNYEYDLDGVRLYSDIDMIMDGKMLFFRMFRPKINVYDIMNGKNCAPMVSCLIANRADCDVCINEFQIWDMHGLGNKPVDITDIAVSSEAIDSLEEKLKGVLSSCDINICRTSEKHKHFKRI